MKPFTTAGLIPDVRAVELLEAVGTAEARSFLRELAAEDPDAIRTSEARKALARLGESGLRPGGGQTLGAGRP
jgi:hypothetical protein